MNNLATRIRREDVKIEHHNRIKELIQFQNTTAHLSRNHLTFIFAVVCNCNKQNRCVWFCFHFLTFTIEFLSLSYLLMFTISGFNSIQEVSW